MRKQTLEIPGLVSDIVLDGLEMNPDTTSSCAPSTLNDLLRHRAESDGRQQAYAFIDRECQVSDSLTWSEVYERSLQVAAALQRQTRPGDRVLLSFSPGLDFVVAYYACLLASVIPVPSHAPRAPSHGGALGGIATDAGVRLTVTNAGLLERVRDVVGSGCPVEGVESLLQRGGRYADVGAKPDDLALLQYTSGSTGSPKGVMVSHRNLLANSSVIAARFGHGSESRGVIWLPAYHDMGLIGGVLQPMYVGFPVWLMAPLDFLQRPARWLRAISLFGATTSGGPDMAYRLCHEKVSDEEMQSLDLSSWRVAFNGAEAVRRSTLDGFSRRFAAAGFERRAFLPCYGLAEATLMVSGGYAGSGRRNTRTIEEATPFAASGEICASQHVRVVDPDALRVCAEGEVGELWVDGPSKALGYWNQPELSERTFRATLEGEERRFLRTGDLGFLRDGELHVCGRLKDVIIVGGRNIAAEDVEACLHACHPGISGCGVVAFGHERDGREVLVIVQEVTRSTSRRPLELKEIETVARERIARERGLSVGAFVPVLYGTIPRTTSGKLRRGRCRDLWTEGALTSLHDRESSISQVASEASA